MTGLEWVDLIFKFVMASAALVFLSKFWTLKGRVEEFLTNHWPSFVKQVDGMHKEVHENSKRLARLEGRK